jgi:hypothetical protein
MRTLMQTVLGVGLSFISHTRRVALAGARSMAPTSPSLSPAPSAPTTSPSTGTAPAPT